MLYDKPSYNVAMTQGYVFSLSVAIIIFGLYIKQGQTVHRSEGMDK